MASETEKSELKPSRVARMKATKISEELSLAELVQAAMHVFKATGEFPPNELQITAFAESNREALEEYIRSATIVKLHATPLTLVLWAGMEMTREIRERFMGASFVRAQAQDGKWYTVKSRYSKPDADCHFTYENGLLTFRVVPDDK
jgi:hypothetical protein